MFVPFGIVGLCLYVYLTASRGAGGLLGTPTGKPRPPDSPLPHPVDFLGRCGCQRNDGLGRRDEIAAAIASVDVGAGVIILTDLFGGTPSNLAISLLDAGHVEVIAGINLPMLIRLAGARKAMGVVEAVEAAQVAGRNYITVASELLGADTPRAASGGK